MGKLVLAYEARANNETLQPRLFYALYIGPNDGVLVIQYLSYEQNR